MKFVDAAPIAGTRRTADGYLVAEVRTARTGIQDYAGWEVGKPDMQVVRVYRGADQVFAKDSLATYAHRPLTNNHPDEAVTADNWKDHAVGQIGDEVARDGEFVRIPLIVMDAAAIKAIEGGKRELSAGYTCDLAFEAGTTPEGQTFDAVQRNIKINHVAIVDRGRAGSQARIGDGAGKWGLSPITPTQDKEIRSMENALRTVVVDGLSVQTTDQGAQAISKLQKDLESSAAKFADAEASHVKAIAAKDAEIAKKDAEIDGLKAKVLDGAALDAAVAARGDLLAKAKAIAPDVKTDGLSDAAIRKAVVVAKLGDAMKDKAEAYIDARFDILAEDAAGDEQVRSAITNLKTNVGDEATKAGKAYADSVTDMNSWRNQKEA